MSARKAAGPVLRRIVYLSAIGLVLGTIVHLLVILLVPALAEGDAWAKLSRQGEPWAMHRLNEPGSGVQVLPDADPAFLVAGCRFDLGQSGLAVAAVGRVPFWSVSIFDRRGRNIYSFNDRTAVDRELNLLVVNPVQMARLRKNPPQEAERAVLIEAPVGEGFVLVRVLQPDASWRERTETFVAGTSCAPYVIENSEPGAQPERVIEDVPES